MWRVRARPPEAETPKPKKRRPLDVESIYYDQPRLVQAALDGVRPSEPDVAETYFVGFGSYAAEDVFENEVKHVEALFRERFGAEGRSAMLINSRKDARRTAACERPEPAHRTRGYGVQDGIG